ncbi:hypothetical protein JCM17846_02420 [Iodidimonas nitroreducens]|uniref:DUF2059 domain-containing protein n=1 Tax=Iodidimonas nitroreducens TaxID=1236968 RepID=A0A5A7N588_9PROT|nr:DUF2059 domain-containing protein [Iodidimonas nitroreducens]GAK34738.1 hypothetical protein AQ1_02645 [alpha proteobacterium Q-1]GER02560.1 hypothetical protein JCM17846_02420 [Iodidimonas nitroreducens]
MFSTDLLNTQKLHDHSSAFGRPLLGLAMAAVFLLAPFSPQSAFAQSAKTDASQSDEEKFEAIRELVEITQIEAMAAQMIDLFNEDILPLLLESNPEANEQLDRIIREEVAGAMLSLKPDVIALTASVWSRHFTIEEIRVLTAFYQTPLGTKLLEKQPIIARESMQAGMQMSQKAAMTAMEAIKNRLTAENLTVPAQL